MGTRRKTERKRRRGEDGFEAWGGYMNAKISKLEQQFEAESKKLDSSERLSDIFNGVAIFVNGYTEPSSEDLRVLMLLHGGTYHHYYRNEKTTHVIASNLPNAKMLQLKTMRVVKPEWIVKSIEAGKLLDYKNFLLFSKPSVFQERDTIKKAEETSNYVKPIVEYKEQPSVKQQMAKTAVDAQFLSEFYSNSRLHHLSTMGAMFKVYVNELREKHNGDFPGRKRLLELLERESDRQINPGNIDKIIMHIDMDCFFVSVALRNHPELEGKPVAVAHARGNPTHQRVGVDTKFEYEFYKNKMDAKLGLDNHTSSESDDDDGENKPWLSEFSSRSEIASCSYEARKSGVRNGMYLGSALKLCPNLKTVPYDFEGYKEVSYTLYNTVAEYTLDIEAVSCDELFIDCTSLIQSVGIKPLQFAEILRGDIRERTRCPSSVGIGSNKLQARLSTKRAKPNGQYLLPPEEVLTFMSGVDVYDLPGVGRTIGYKLKVLNVKTCQDLQNIPLAVLKKEFGAKTGETLYKYCRGIDDRTVTSSHQRKSVSAEVNYGIRFSKEEEAITFLRQLSTEVANRLKEVNMKGKNITFKVMIRAKDAPTETAKFLGHGACDYTTRSYQMPSPSSEPDIIAKHVINMYQQLSVPACELRGIGIQITKLENCKQVVGALENFLKYKSGDKPIASTSKEAKINNKIQLPRLSQIDHNVLDVLPKDIKLEIMNEYGIDDLEQLKKPTSSSSSSHEKSFKAVDEAQKRNVFGRLSLTDVRKMISEWVSVETRPKKLDIDLLIDYACDLICKNRIEQLDILITCFRRHVVEKRNGNEIWKECYLDVLGRVQESMKKNFGKELLVQDL